MKKSTVKAFTLVEMLIVIVIIGILISALMPRMQAAQWRARDVARKTALSQIQSAIVVSQWDKWRWPGCTNTGCKDYAIPVSEIEEDLRRAWMNGIPKDPLRNSSFSWLNWFTGTTDWDYAYMVARRNGSDNWGFVLMAKTEVEWGSNWVICSGSSDLSGGIIKSTDDLKNITLCETVTYDPDQTCQTNTWDCYAKSEADLRYILMY